MENKFYTLIFCVFFCGLLPARAQDSTGTCTAQFYATVYGQEVFFRAADSVAGVQHFWSFGDSTQLGFGNYVGVTHTYSRPGTYWVTHVIKNRATGCHDSSSQTVVIGGPPPPQCSISFTYSHDSTRGNAPYFFYANAWVNGATHDTVSWTVNGTAAGTGDTLVRYLSRGQYSVCVFLNTNLCRSQSCLTISVGDSVLTPPDSVGKVPPDSLGKVPPDSIGKVPPDSIGTVPPDSTIHRDSTLTMGPDSLANYVSSYPNPSSNVVNMEVKLDEPEMIAIRVYNSMGNQVKLVMVSGMEGVNRLSLPVGGLQSGIYYIQIQYGNVNKRSRIQKL